MPVGQIAYARPRPSWSALGCRTSAVSPRLHLSFFLSRCTLRFSAALKATFVLTA